MLLLCFWNEIIYEAIFISCSQTRCLASPANFIYGRVLAKVFSHVTIMPVLLRQVNTFLGQVIGNASEGKYNTVNNSSSGEVTFQKCPNSGITRFSSKNSNKSQTFATGAYQRLHEARPRGSGNQSIRPRDLRGSYLNGLPKSRISPGLVTNGLKVITTLCRRRFFANSWFSR